MAEIFIMVHLCIGLTFIVRLFYVPKWVAFSFLTIDTLLWTVLIINSSRSFSVFGFVLICLVWLLVNGALWMHTDNTVYEMRAVKNDHLRYRSGLYVPVVCGFIDCNGQPLEVFLENKHLTEDALKQNPTLPVRLLGRRNGSWVVELADKKSASYFENHP